MHNYVPPPDPEWGDFCWKSDDEWPGRCGWQERDHYDASVIVDRLPSGYRWADEYETDRWTDHADKMVQVRVGGTDDDPWTDLAIRIN